MKVLRVIGGLNPRFGGPSVTVVNAAIACARHGLVVHLIFLDPNPEAALRGAVVDRLRDAGVEVDCAPLDRWLGPIGPSYGVSVKLTEFLRGYVRTADVVHIDGAWVHSTLAAINAAKRNGCPMILTPHEGLTKFDIRSSRSLVTRQLKFWLKRYYARVVDVIAFSSDIERMDSSVGEIPDNWITMYHPVYDERLHDVRPRVFSADDRDPFHIGFLGRLHPKKNVDLLIRALAMLPASVSLSIAGSGVAAYENDLRKLARELDVAHRIRWLGFIDPDRRARFLAEIDLLAMPSDYECFGMVAAEGMVAGTPVLVSPTTGVAELIGSKPAGIIATPNVGAVVSSILPLLNNRNRLMEMSEHGVDVARKTLSFQVHGAALSALYESLMGKTKRTQRSLP
jgi:glycosyltransferase involved in cell wall biosynthesis